VRANPVGLSASAALWLVLQQWLGLLNHGFEVIHWRASGLYVIQRRVLITHQPIPVCLISLVMDHTDPWHQWSFEAPLSLGPRRVVRVNTPGAGGVAD
jgi:hypothetical protein